VYVELHARSAFSFLEATALPETLVERAAALGQPAMALVDRDGLYGAPRFYRAATRLGIASLVGAETHFMDNRTQPHIEPAQFCEGCHRRIDKRWKGYLGCWDRHVGRLCLAEVTTEAFKTCRGFKEHANGLRGMALNLSRNGMSRNARCTAKLSMYGTDGPKMPPEFDVKAALERLWFGGDNGVGLVKPVSPEGPSPDVRYAAGQGELFRVEGPYGR
jgi:hypothetical protein